MPCHYFWNFIFLGHHGLYSCSIYILKLQSVPMFSLERRFYERRTIGISYFILYMLICVEKNVYCIKLTIQFLGNINKTYFYIILAIFDVYISTTIDNKRRFVHDAFPGIKYREHAFFLPKPQNLWFGAWGFGQRSCRVWFVHVRLCWIFIFYFLFFVQVWTTRFALTNRFKWMCSI